MIFEIFVAVSIKNMECCALYSERDLPNFLLWKPASWIFKPEELYGEEAGVRFLRNVGKPLPEDNVATCHHIPGHSKLH